MAKVGRPPKSTSLKDYFATGSGRKLWKEGQEQKEEGGSALPVFDDGKYSARIIKAGVGQSQRSNRWQNMITFKFLEGEYKGKTVTQYQGIDNPVGIAILLSSFEKLGFEIESPDEIEEIDKKLTKTQPAVEIRLSTKGEFQNVVINEVSDEDAENADDEDEEESDDADVDDADDDEDDEPKSKKKKSKAAKEDEDEEEEADEDDDSDDEDEDEEEESDDEDEDEEDEPKKKSSKKSKSKDDDEEDEDEDEDDEEKEETDGTKLEVGMKLKIKHDDDEVTGKIVKVMEEKSQVKVKLKNGDKVVVNVPDDIIDVVE